MSKGEDTDREVRLDDQALIRAVLDGDRAAEHLLYDRHVERIYGLAHRMTGDPSSAEDLTQETFVRAFDRLPSFRGESAFSTWLHTIAMSVILNGLRASRNRRNAAPLDLVRELPARRQSPPDLKRALYAAVDELPESLRTSLLLHDVEGFTHEEIASMLGIPSGTSKARLSRARGQLRRIFTDEAEAFRSGVCET